MSYYSAFQNNAFQNNAFQIKRGATPPPPPAADVVGDSVAPYILPYQKYLSDEYQRNKLAEKQIELKRIDDEIAEAEKRRLAALKRAQANLLAEKAAKRLAAQERKLQDEIDKLRNERAWLIRQIDDEECVLIIMMRKRKRLI